LEIKRTNATSERWTGRSALVKVSWGCASSEDKYDFFCGLAKGSMTHSTETNRSTAIKSLRRYTARVSGSPAAAAAAGPAARGGTGPHFDFGQEKAY